MIPYSCVQWLQSGGAVSRFLFRKGQARCPDGLGNRGGVC
jgi:hypothetical protein